MAVYIDPQRRPKYAGIWDKTKSYNPYSIVVKDSDYFISASPVPSGIEITNDSYWIWYASEGDPSALEARVAALETKVTALEGFIGTDIDHINTDSINFVKMITGIN